MKNTFGHNYSVTIFGESHGEAIGCVIDGLAPGIKLDMDFIASVMESEKQRAEYPHSEKRQMSCISSVAISMVIQPVHR